MLYNNRKIKAITFLVAIMFSVIFYFYKLGYESFFTDEIIYIKAGREAILDNKYSLILEVPFLGKYLAGASSFADEWNIYLMRTPYAIIGLVSAFVVFLILRKHLGFFWGILGYVLFILSPILYYATRMVMLEAPLHLFWLLFSYFFLEFLDKQTWRNSLLSGLFIGLALGTKFTSVLLYPVSGIVLLIMAVKIKKEDRANLLKKSFLMYIMSISSFFLTYLGFILKVGISGFYDILRAIKDNYVSNETDGKIHVIDGSVYKTSPWWYYFYYINKFFTYPQMVLYSAGAFTIAFKKNLFVIYWTIFFLIIFLFQQTLLLKNMRYFSSIELPLIFLCVALANFIYEKAKKATRLALIVFIGLILAGRVSFALNIIPTKYNSLQDFLIKNTKNFTNGERTYIFGSIRSSKWYFSSGTQKKTSGGSYIYRSPADMVVSRKDFDVIGIEFKYFKYIAIDDDEAPKGQATELIDFLRTNSIMYNVVHLPGITVFVNKGIK